MRVLFLTIGPTTEPSSRFRVYQYLDALRDRGIEATVRPLAGPRYVEWGYGRRRPPAPLRALWAAAHFAGRVLRRARDLWDARRFDVVVVQKEVFPFGAERLVSWLGLRVVYDFDDAIHLPSPLEDARGRTLRRLSDALVRRHRALPALLRRSAVVVAGNRALADYARGYADRVRVLPTPVDTAAYVPRREREPGPLRVGWFGAPATAVYLDALRPALRELAERHAFELWLLGTERFDCPGVRVECRPWRPYASLAEEVVDLQRFDVGLMPLPDDPYAASKCALKAIQYMACGVPVVASPVGAARDVVEDGGSGFLAGGASEWVDRLDRLLSDAALRERLGRAGRTRVLERYSLDALVPQLLEVLAEAGSAGAASPELRSRAAAPAGSRGSAPAPASR